jgi:metal-sulfur cluster biosynthetic enzyme
MNQADQLEQVRAALNTVTDPEIDEVVTTLEFVSSLRVSDDNDGSIGRH